MFQQQESRGGFLYGTCVNQIIKTVKSAKIMASYIDFLSFWLATRPHWKLQTPQIKLPVEQKAEGIAIH